MCDAAVHHPNIALSMKSLPSFLISLRPCLVLWVGLSSRALVEPKSMVFALVAMQVILCVDLEEYRSGAKY
jgi:hypothetical protein